MTFATATNTLLLSALLLILSCITSTADAQENTGGKAGNDRERKTVSKNIQCPGSDCPGKVNEAEPTRARDREKAPERAKEPERAKAAEKAKAPQRAKAPERAK